MTTVALLVRDFLPVLFLLWGFKYWLYLVFFRLPAGAPASKLHSKMDFFLQPTELSFSFSMPSFALQIYNFLSCCFHLAVFPTIPRYTVLIDAVFEVAKYPPDCMYNLLSRQILVITLSQNRLKVAHAEKGTYCLMYLKSLGVQVGFRCV